MSTLAHTLDAWAPAARRRAEALELAPRLDSIGRIDRIADGIAMISGLPDVRAEELLAFGGGIFGIARTLEPDSIGCVLLDPHGTLTAGDTVHGTGRVASVPVGEALLGRIVDPLGRPLDGGPPLVADRFDPVDRPAPAIIERELVVNPLQTGVVVVDAMFAIGRGQRELIIGDRATGKTALALDAIINQRHSNVVCIYAAIGQRTSTVKRVVEAVRHYGDIRRTVFVVAEAATPPGLQSLAPYAAMTIAEFFRDRGDDALLVLDDLTKHASVHRTIALLLHQPPGREAFPGDVFYAHSRLLERAARLSRARGGGSLTALPIAETQAGNLAAYIPTNLISITDGQLYLDAKLFAEGQRPAVDVGRSVSRVGGKTQRPALREAAAGLRLAYAQFLEIEMFSRFGGMTDERSRRTIAHGRRIRAALAQDQHAPLDELAQVALLTALNADTLDRLDPAQVTAFKARLPAAIAALGNAPAASLAATGTLPVEARTELLVALARLADSVVAAAA